MYGTLLGCFSVFSEASPMTTGSGSYSTWWWFDSSSNGSVLARGSRVGCVEGEAASLGSFDLGCFEAGNMAKIDVRCTHGVMEQDSN